MCFGIVLPGVALRYQFHLTTTNGERAVDGVASVELHCHIHVRICYGVVIIGMEGRNTVLHRISILHGNRVAVVHYYFNTVLRSQTINRVVFTTHKVSSNSIVVTFHRVVGVGGTVIHTVEAGTAHD